MAETLQETTVKSKSFTPRQKKIYPLLRLVPYLRRYPMMLILSLLALLVAAFATLLMPFALRLVIDQGFLADNRDAIDVYFKWLLVIVSVLAMGSALRFFCAYWVAERLVADLKRDVFEKLIAVSAAFFDKNHSGEIMSHLAADTTLINISIRSNVSQALRNVVVLIGGLLMMVVSSPSLSFLVICAIPIIVLPLVFYGRMVRRLSHKSQDALASLNQYGAEALLNVRTVQAFGAERQVVDEFMKSNEESVAMSLVRTKARSILTAVSIFFVLASIVFILWYGARDVIDGRMSGGALMQFMLYAVFAGGAMAALTEVWGEIAQAAGAADRLSAFLDVRSDVVERSCAKDFKSPVSGDIEFRNVTFAYPQRSSDVVLADVSFQIKAGQRVAIVGASGAGKSTLFQLLLRFYDPVAGEILLDGQVIKNHSLDDLRRAFALVPQEPNLFDASIYDNIAFAKIDAPRRAVIDAAKAAQAHEFVSQFQMGYDTLVGEGGQSLSGGQRQRIALARAILRDAPVLLLDEATSSLDATNEEKVKTALDQIMKNRTSLIIAHRLSTVMNADRILVFDRGRFVEEGVHSELIERDGIYAELARTQLSIED